MSAMNYGEFPETAKVAMMNGVSANTNVAGECRGTRRTGFPKPTIPRSFASWISPASYRLAFILIIVSTITPANSGQIRLNPGKKIFLNLTNPPSL